MFFIQFFSFAQFAYLIFGTHMEQYSTLTSCIYTQFRMVLGDFDFPAMRRAHAFLGPTYFFVFIFLVFFILMVSYFIKKLKMGIVESQRFAISWLSIIFGVYCVLEYVHGHIE